jgi:hypothetical protein
VISVTTLRPKRRSTFSLNSFAAVFLLGVVKEDKRPVLCADVEALTIKRGGVMDLPEQVGKLFVGDVCRVIFDVRDRRVPR